MQDDEGKPYFNIGDYAEVHVSTYESSFWARICCGSASFWSSDTATLSSVKYDDVGGGRIYTNVPVCHMTGINFGWYFDLPRSQHERIRPGETEEKDDEVQLLP